MTPTRLVAFFAVMSLCLPAVAGGDSPPEFHRNEIKLSGLSPGLHYEHFFLRRISTDAGISYSPYNFYPYAPAYPIQREVSKVVVSGRLYFGDHKGTRFYWGLYNSLCHQWLHTPHAGENSQYYSNGIGAGIHLYSSAVGLELGHKLPFRERLTIESNVGVGYNYFFRTYQNNYLLATSTGPVVSYGSGINYNQPIDLKMWVSINYLLGDAK